MKRILFILFVIFCFISCDSIHDPSDTSYIKQDSIVTQEFFNKYIKETIITNSEGHQVVFYEYNNRHSKYYRFSINHAINCKKCKSK